MVKTARLALEIFSAPSRPVIRPERPLAPPGGWNWPPTAAVLIAGERDAVIVDTLVTMTDAEQLADWIEARRRRLTMIYVTHDHADHYLGAPILLRRFPEARLVALPQVVEDIRPQLTSGLVERYWKPMFDGDIAGGQVLPEPLADGRIDIEGHDIFAVQAGQSDTAHSTYLHIPELGAVIAGDIAYNDVHMQLGGTDHAKRMRWIKTLCEIGSLNPRTVIAAHCRPNAPNTPDVVAKSISYIVDFDRIFATGPSASGLIDGMKAAHPTRLSLTTLYSAAYMLAS